MDSLYVNSLVNDFTRYLIKFLSTQEAKKLFIEIIKGDAMNLRLMFEVLGPLRLSF